MLRFACFCLAILPLLGACQLARMQVSPDLATVEPFAVDRALWRLRKPNDPLSFGSWRTTHIDVGWGRFRARPQPIIFGGKTALDFESFERPYRLDVETSDGVISAECVAAPKPSHTRTGRSTAALCKAFRRCTVRTSAQPGRDGAAGDADARGVRRGEHRVRGYPVAPEVGQSHRRRPRTREYRRLQIRSDSEVLAAVEVMNSGRVWMSPELTSLQQDRVAAVAMALLLYESPQDEIERIREQTSED